MLALLLKKLCAQGMVLVLGLGPLGCLCGPRVTAQSQTSQTKDRKVSIARPVQGLERRVALVIGNGNYPFGSLRNPVNDATDMAKTLTNLGFEVISRTDVTQRQMLALISDFGKQLQSGGVGLFYFAGHGVQVSGDNFLIPVDAEIKTDADVDVYCVELNKVLKQMQTATGFRETVRFQPASGDYLRNLAVHLFQQNMFAEAIPQLKNYLQTEPTDGKMHFTLGLAYEQTLDFQKAEAAFATALDLKKSKVEYHHGLGQVLEKQGRIQAALASSQTLNPLCFNFS